MEFVPSLWQYQTGKFLKMQEASDLKIKLLFYSRSSTQYSWKQTFLHDTVWNSHKLEQIFVFVKSYSIKISHPLRGTDTKTINSTEQTKVSWIFYGRPYHLHPPVLSDKKLIHYLIVLKIHSTILLIFTSKN